MQILNRLNMGGISLNAAILSKYLAPEYETLLVTGMIDETEESSDFLLHNMGLKPVYIPEMYRAIDPLRDRKAYFKIKQLIKEFKPDIVHTHAAKAGTLGRLAAAACKVPVIVHTFHGHVFHSYFPGWQTRMFIGIERFLAEKSSCIISISERQRRELSKIYKICSHEKIEVVPLGFDLSRFSDMSGEKRKLFRSKYLVDDDEIAIVIVGRLVPVKNHGLFLRSIQSVAARSRKKIRAFIVGDGEERKNLEALAQSLELDFTDFESAPRKATVTFTSWIRDIDNVYAGSDVVALTSLNEGTPMSIIEGLAAGKPIVATRVGGITDIVHPGLNALIAPRTSERVFSKHLLRLVDDDALRNNMAQYKDGIMERFNSYRLVKDMSQIYSQLLTAS